MSRMAFLTLRLRALPRRAAQPVDRRPRRAGVFLNEIEPLDRNEELVVAGVAQLEKLLRALSPTPICFRPTNIADAVVDVDDEIADLQVAQVGEKRLRRRPPALAARAALPRRHPVSA